MKLIMENWRGYQEELLSEQEELLMEAGILDALKNGFKKLMNAPGTLEKLVARAKKIFQSTMKEKLEALASSDQMQKAGQQIASAINNAGAKLNESEAEAIAQKGLSLQDLKKMGVDPSTLELIANSLTDTNVEAVLEACEEAVNTPVPPRVRDFLKRFLKKSSKMIMFGFIDNFVMIVAGDYIDQNIARTLGFSTMAAAGMGNMVSDIAGEEAGSALDKAIEKLGLDVEDISDEQMEAAPGWMRFMDQRSGSFGVAIGCILGMVPLLFKEEAQE
jgi:predicted membrane chloride channel (bestrophin family)